MFVLSNSLPRVSFPGQMSPKSSASKTTNKSKPVQERAESGRKKSWAGHLISFWPNMMSYWPNISKYDDCDDDY